MTAKNTDDMKQQLADILIAMGTLKMATYNQAIGRRPFAATFRNAPGRDIQAEMAPTYQGTGAGLAGFDLLPDRLG